MTVRVLNELKMSPGIFAKFLNSPLADGIRAGFEAEVVFRGIRDVNDAADDGLADPGVPSGLDEVLEFFNPIPQRIWAPIRAAYNDWVQERLDGEWESVDHDVIREAIDEWFDSNDDVDKIVFDKLLKEYTQDEINETFNSPVDWGSVTEDSSIEMSGALIWYNIREEVCDAVLQNLECPYDLFDSNEFRESAKEKWEKEAPPYLFIDEYRWLSETFNDMRDISSTFDLDEYWPSSSDADFDADLARAVLLPSFYEITAVSKVVAADGYHQGRPANTWVFENDSSIKVDDTQTDMPCEIISPPMPLKMCVECLPEFFQWLKDYDAYTNKSTGFHVGVSLPNVGGQVDYLKLALFLGDEHVLQSFGRAANALCTSSLEHLFAPTPKGVSQYGPSIVNPAVVLDHMRLGVDRLAQAAIAKNTTRYAAINMKDDYVEFRHAGGDYMSKGVDEMMHLVLRYAYAMSVASNPEIAKDEYAKKLYKVLDKSFDYYKGRDITKLKQLMGNFMMNPPGSPKHDQAKREYVFALQTVIRNRVRTLIPQNTATAALPDVRDAETLPVTPKTKSYWVVSPTGVRVSVSANSPQEARGMAKIDDPAKFNYPSYMIKVSEA